MKKFLLITFTLLIIAAAFQSTKTLPAQDDSRMLLTAQNVEY
jgi:hypothetical protein